ncbi:hypothetical protein AB4Z54_73750, partial [Streptomyces sp. MCAF7]
MADAAEELQAQGPYEPQQFAGPAAEQADVAEAIPAEAEFQGVGPAVGIPAQVVHPDSVPPQQEPGNAPAAEGFAGPVADIPAQSHPQAEPYAQPPGQPTTGITIPAQSDGTATPAEPAPQPVP